MNPFGYRPPVLGFEREGLENQEVERPLNQVVWFRHTMVIYNTDCRLSRGADLVLRPPAAASPAGFSPVALASFPLQE